jgi:hypothetical protein
MSEYQYYEFRAIDQPLTQKQVGELRNISSRARIDSRSLVNEYNFGNFRGNVDQLMREYFDAHLYLANWGTHTLVFRLPRRLVDVAVFDDYFDGEQNTLAATDDVVIAHFRSNLEGGEGWVSGEGELEPLLGVREELLAGDLRALYIAWLSGMTDDLSGVGEPAAVLEPPVPPGLKNLTAAQKAFAEYMRVEPDLLAAAAERSDDRAADAGPEAGKLLAWLREEPAGRKDAWLVQLLLASDPAARWEVLAEFRKTREPAASWGAGEPRTLAALLARAEVLEAERESAAAAARAAEKRRAEAARGRQLDGLRGQEERLWAEAEQAVQTKKKDAYEQAVAHLKDLHDLAARAGQGDAFGQRLKELRARHAGKSAFLRQLDAARLMP